MMKYITNSVIRQIGFIALFLILFGIILYHLSAFLPGVLGAVCLFIILQHPMRWLHIKKGWNKVLVTIFLILGSGTIILAPLYLLVRLLTKKLSIVFTRKDDISFTINNALEKIHAQIGIDVLDEKYLANATEIGANIIKTVMNTTIDSVLQFFIALLILYFMLMNYKELDHWLKRNIPLKKDNLTELNANLKNMVISNAVGVPLVSFLQSCVAYIGFVVFGLPDANSWFVLIVFAGMIPIVGTALVYIPAFVMMLANGETMNAYLFLAYCVLVVGSVDNIFRFLLQKKLANIHPLVTIFGVVVGVNLFGFIGIIFGPILFSLLFWMFNLYKLEFSNHFVDDNQQKIS